MYSKLNLRRSCPIGARLEVDRVEVAPDLNDHIGPIAIAKHSMGLVCMVYIDPDFNHPNVCRYAIHGVFGIDNTISCALGPQCLQSRLDPEPLL